MNLMGRGCCVLLLFISATGNAKMDGYYSQAIDIDYALSGEDETIRVSLERMFKQFLGLLSIDTDEELMLWTPEFYYGQEKSDEELSILN